MDDILHDPNIQIAFWSFAGALLAVAVPKIFAWLKSLAAKTENTIDDKAVEYIENLVEGILKKKFPGK